MRNIQRVKNIQIAMILHSDWSILCELAMITNTGSSQAEVY